MALSSGFFNGFNGDRVYDATDFSNYLEGIIVNGCFPNDLGFKVLPNSDLIGGDPPSVIISSGKAYLDGMWIINDADYVYFMGEAQQTVPGRFHLLYFCFDTTDDGRTVTIDCLTSATPVIPTDADGKFYMPLAIVADQLNVQPDASNITDQRLMAGAALPAMVQHFVGAVGEPAFDPSWDNEYLFNTWFGKDALGFVHISGVIESTAGAGTPFVLPEGYRPINTVRYYAMAYNVNGYIQVNTNGEVYVSSTDTFDLAYLDIPPFLAA